MFVVLKQKIRIMLQPQKEEQYAKNTPTVSDHLANERTFLAWLRTSIGIMAFGFVVVKFSLFMKQLSLALGKPLAPNPKGVSPILGVSLVCVGLLTTFFSYLRFLHTKKQLDNHSFESSSLLVTVLIVSIWLVGALLVAYLIQSI
jgi:putative membrane protein